MANLCTPTNADGFDPLFDDVKKYQSKIYLHLQAWGLWICDHVKGFPHNLTFTSMSERIENQGRVYQMHEVLFSKVRIISSVNNWKIHKTTRKIEGWTFFTSKQEVTSDLFLNNMEFYSIEFSQQPANFVYNLVHWVNWTTMMQPFGPKFSKLGWSFKQSFDSTENIIWT